MLAVFLTAALTVSAFCGLALVACFRLGVGVGSSEIGAGRRAVVIMRSATVNDKNAFLFKLISWV
jgi:hypothetical protein